MTIDFTCQKCEGGFEIEALELIDGSEKLECPHCGAKVSQAATDDFTSALADLQKQIAALAKKFTLSLELDSRELSEPSDDADEEEDEDEDDDDEEDLEEADDS